MTMEPFAALHDSRSGGFHGKAAAQTPHVLATLLPYPSLVCGQSSAACGAGEVRDYCNAASETGFAIKIFSFAVRSKGSQAQKEEHEAPITLYHVRLALASATVTLVALLESPGSFQLATARSKTHAAPLGQPGPNLPVPEQSEMSCIAQESWAEER